MARLNLTLDDDTMTRLSQHARRRGAQRATLARQILREGLERQEALDRARKLAADYAEGRADARELLAEMERPQLDILLAAEKR